VGSSLVAALRRLGHDVDYVRDWPGDPGDLVILRTAYTQGRVLITLDNDFGELIFEGGQPHAGVIRLTHDLNRQQRLDLCLRILAEIDAASLERSLVTAKKGGSYKLRLNH
jgi:predicted nuclease of predicted toxin-antitoxin system